MGREATCSAQHGDAGGTGKLLLETDDLQFRGASLKLRIPLKQIESAVASSGELRVTWPAGLAVFALGDAAQKWADSINNPKSLLDKLGVKPDQIVSVIGVQDADFLADLQRRVSAVTIGKALAGSDLIFYQADEPQELKRLEQLAKKIQPAGAVWVITPKKRPEIADTVVMKAGKSAGLVDVKVARFSETHTALKFVVPRASRIGDRA